MLRHEFEIASDAADEFFVWGRFQVYVDSNIRTVQYLRTPQM